MIRYQKFGKALELIELSHKVIVTSHIRPDGDAIGSVRAMCLAIEAMEKQAIPVFLSEIPKWYEFLFDERPMVLGRDFQIEDITAGSKGFDDVDLMVIVDTNSYVQLPGLADWLKERTCPVVVFDHHITNDSIGDAQAIDTSSAAAAEVVFDFIAYSGTKISAQMAQELFVGIASDTGWFRFGNKDGSVYRRAASLIDFGIDPAGIYQKLYQNFEVPKLKLAARGIQNMQLALNEKLCIQVITQQDLIEIGANRQDTEGMIEEGQKLGSVRVAANFTEQIDGSYKCSLRSKGEVNVRTIAQKYGGGGHDFAAGVTFNIPLEQAKQIIIDEVSAQIDHIK